MLVTRAVAAGVLAFAMASAAPRSALASNAWSIEPTPNAAGTTHSYLNGVSCPDATTCTAAGYYLIGSPGYTPFLERWSTSGGWSLQTVPNENQGVVLRGDSCASDTSCTAVGQRLVITPVPGAKPPFRTQWWTAAEQWNGSTWSIQNPSYTWTLFGVSCPAANLCTAVGQMGGATLAERWNGTAWTPQTPYQTGALLGVSCPTATDCVAVGTTNLAIGTQAVVARWDKSSGTWTFQTSLGYLSAVSCPTATDCMAVGDSNGATLTELWNGTTWSIEPTLQPSGATSSALTSVSCASPTACTAVGNFVNAVGGQQTLAEQWNGTTWSAPSLPPEPTGATTSTVTSVSCTSATTCTAVGDYVNSSGIQQTLAESYRA